MKFDRCAACSSKSEGRYSHWRNHPGRAALARCSTRADCPSASFMSRPDHPALTTCHLAVALAVTVSAPCWSVLRASPKHCILATPPDRHALAIYRLLVRPPSLAARIARLGISLLWCNNLTQPRMYGALRLPGRGGAYRAARRPRGETFPAGLDCQWFVGAESCP